MSLSLPPPPRAASGNIFRNPAAIAGIAVLVLGSVAAGTYALVKHNPFKKADATANPAQQTPAGQPGTNPGVNPAATPGAVPTAAGDPNAMPQPTPDAGFAGAGGNPNPSTPNRTPSGNPSPATNPGGMPQPTPSSSVPNPNPAPDVNPAANPPANPAPAPSVTPAPAASAAAYTLPFNNSKFRVRVASRLSTETSEEGQAIRATVLTPTPYKGCTLDGVVQKTGRTGFIGMRKVELLFTFYAIHFPDGTARNIDSRVVAVTNSHGQVNVDEEGEKVDTNNAAKKIFITTAGGAIIGAITGRSKDSTVKGANTGAGVGVALTSVAAKGKVMSFAPGSVFALQVTDKQDSN